MLSLVQKRELQELAEEFISQVKDAIKNKPIRRRSRRPGVGIFEAPVNATGKLAESVHFEFTDEGIEVKCFEYIDKLIFGQGPGEAVSTLDIENWLAAKDLGFNPQTIAQQIYRFGNSIYAEHQGGDSGLLEDVNIDLNIEQLQQGLTKYYADLLAVKLIQEFKQAA